MQPGRIEIESAHARLTIAPDLGASITEFSIPEPASDRWRPVMRSTPEADDASDTACFVMAPWTNRIANAAFHFNGGAHTVTPNRPEGTSIHGVFRDRPFRILDRSPVSARLAAEVEPGEAWPFACALEVICTLIEDKLDVALRLTNRHDTPMPAGVGLHPYFNRRLWAEGPDESAIARVPIEGRYPATDCLPTARPVTDDASRRLQSGAPTDELSPLDDVFNAWRGPAEIVWPASGVRLRMDVDPIYTHAVVFVPPNDHPELGGLFCVEPCSMVNDAFNLAHQGWPKTGLVALEPGETLDAACSITIERI